MLLVNFIDSVSWGYSNTEKKADVQCSIFDKIRGTLSQVFDIKTTTKQNKKETKAEVLVIKMEW